MAEPSKKYDMEELAHQMAVHAQEQYGVSGAAVASYIFAINRETGACSGITGEFVTRLSRLPDPVHRGSDDKGTDYLAMAEGKKAKRLRHELGHDTGTPPVRRGEDEATGDAAKWVGEALLVIAAFSGGSIEQDTEIAEWGISKYSDEFQSPRWLSCWTSDME